MTSRHGNTYYITGLELGIPFTETFNVELWCFLVVGVNDILNKPPTPLQQCHNERYGVSNLRCFDCLWFVQAQINDNIKAPRHWPLWGEFTGDRLIPRTKGQERGKCFHLMTSSWNLEQTVMTCNVMNISPSQIFPGRRQCVFNSVLLCVSPVMV